MGNPFAPTREQAAAALKELGANRAPIGKSICMSEGQIKEKLW
jgi:hypothetical protein